MAFRRFAAFLSSILFIGDIHFFFLSFFLSFCFFAISLFAFSFIWKKSLLFLQMQHFPLYFNPPPPQQLRFPFGRRFFFFAVKNRLVFLFFSNRRFFPSPFPSHRCPPTSSLRLGEASTSNAAETRRLTAFGEMLLTMAVLK